jgi:hypothetical protein
MELAEPLFSIFAVVFQVEIYGMVPTHQFDGGARHFLVIEVATSRGNRLLGPGVLGHIDFLYDL